MEFRSRNAVRALHALEEGFGLAALPNGVYGFSFDPAYGDSPLFRDQAEYAFEVHKLRDGSAFLLGFVSAGDAELIDNCPQEAHVCLYAHPVDCAPKPVGLPSSRIVRYKDYALGGAAAIEIMVVPSGLCCWGATPPSFRAIPAASRAL